MDTKRLDELARKLAELVPPGVRGLGDELERTFRAVLTSTFARLDLVTREEFELQQALLARTIADLADAATVGPAHVAEAVSYRRLDRR